ncbi:unnamed protein product [Prunus brigantina]
MMFLLYWLNRFIFPNRSSAVLLEYGHLAEALHNHTDVGLGPIVLAHLFKNLHTATLENPLNLSAPSAFWMIQIWLQVYFPELRFLDIVLPEDQVLALPLMSVEVPKHSIEEYLMFFRHGTNCNRATSWRDLDDWKCIRMPNGLPASSTALKVLFDGWESWTVYAGVEAKQFMVQMIKDINAQVIEDRSLLLPLFLRSFCNIGGQAVQAGEVIAAGDLELPSGNEGDEGGTLAEPTPSAKRNKRKEIAQAQDSVVQPETSGKLRKRAVTEYVAIESATAPATTSGTDEELRESFEAVEQEKKLEKEEPQEKTKEMEDEEEVPAEVIVESITLAQKQQEAPMAELTRSELALFEDAEAEHSTAILSFQVEVPRTAGTLAVMTSPLKPPIIVVSTTCPSTTASFADPELAKFEAMDLDAQLDKLERLNSTPGKVKSKAVDEAMERVKIWQSTELELDENREVVDQLMKDLDLLHKQNMALKPILEMSLGLARDVLNLHDR